MDRLKSHGLQGLVTTGNGGKGGSQLFRGALCFDILTWIGVGGGETGGRVNESKLQRTYAHNPNTHGDHSFSTEIVQQVISESFHTHE